jgi:tetratricopeptide (TPR) repeat protein
MNNDAYSTFKSNDFHHKSEVAREDERYLESLQFIDEAFIEYQEENNLEGIARGLQSRCLTYKHLFLLSKDKSYAVMGKKDAEASLEIAQMFNLDNILSSSYFRLGEMAMLFEEYGQAVDFYQKSLDKYTGTNCEKGDYRYHLGEAIYRSGNKEKGIEVILAGLKEIQENRSDVNNFLANVWESGVYIRLAELSKDSSNEKAREYVEKAKIITDLDPKLIIRKRQVSKLIEELG